MTEAVHEEEALDATDATPDFGYLRADEPIEHRDQDRLGRKRLVEELADQVMHGPQGLGLVIGLIGEWGSGKTSVLNMIAATVREKSDTVVLTFDPWLFSGTDELVTRFLQELGSQLKETASHGQSKIGLAGDAMLDYAEALEPLSWLPVVGVWAARVSKLAKGAKAIRTERRSEPSTHARRDAVRQALKNLDRRVLVIVDDLDRLEPEQIRDVVRLVRLVGNFPNTTYLLAYSQAVVERALSLEPERSTEDGAAYLEKIVQAPHRLPYVPESVRLRLFGEELEAAIRDIECGPFEESLWPDVLAEGIRPFLTTLRASARLLNIVPTTLRLIGPEVGLVDVLALETMRLFASAAWDRLPESVSALTGQRLVIGEDDQQRLSADRAQIEKIIEAAGERQTEAVRAILRRLFPRAEALLDGSPSAASEPKLTSLRVSHPDVLRTYLQCQVAEGQIGGSLVRRAYANLGDREALASLLDSLEPSSAEAVIAGLEDFQHEFDPAVVEPAIEILLNQLPRLREDRSNMFDAGGRMVVDRVVLRLLRRLDDPARTCEVVSNVMPRVPQLSGRLELINLVGHRREVGNGLVSEEDARGFYESWLSDLKAASNDQLASERNLFGVFAQAAHDLREDVHSFVQIRCEDDEVLLQLLRSALSTGFSQPMNTRAFRRKLMLPWKLLAFWFGGEDRLNQRITEVGERVDRDSLPPRTRAALETAERYVSGELTPDPDVGENFDDPGES